LSRLHKARFIVDIKEEKAPKGYWKAVNGPKGHLWKEAGNKEMDR
jgi:hypothetical protein